MADRVARIVVAERWSVLRRGLTGVLREPHQVIADVEDLTEVAQIIPGRSIDLVVTGDDPALAMPLLISQLVELPEAPAVLVLSEEIDAARLRDLLQAGARGVLSRKVDDLKLLEGVDRILIGDRVVDQRFLPMLFAGEQVSRPEPSEPSLLTSREQDVLVLLAKGCSNREIASTLVLGESTVKTHLARIYGKLGVDDRHHAVSRAFELGLIA